MQEFYKDRFREEFTPTLQPWIASEPLKNAEAPASPFDMKEYSPAMRDQAEELEEKAGALFMKGMDANP